MTMTCDVQADATYFDVALRGMQIASVLDSVPGANHDLDDDGGRLAGIKMLDVSAPSDAARLERRLTTEAHHPTTWARINRRH